LFGRLLKAPALRSFRKARRERKRVKRALKALSRFPRHPDAPRHGLPADLVVSLTSYPPRFPTLHLTIKSLLDQTVRPDRIVLWIASEDWDALPGSVTALQGERFTVRTYDDMRSFKKIVPALIHYPDAFILIADDDVFYPPSWIGGLVDAHDPCHPAILYYRGHRIVYGADGALAPYRRWQREVNDNECLLPSTDVMPTGVGGVLYPPGSLPAATVDVPLFKQLSPTCDDSWLYFMWRGNGWKARRVPGEKLRVVTWPDTQEQSLMTFHRGGKKDEHLRALSDHFGIP
jgi:hypothetical protein